MILAIVGNKGGTAKTSTAISLSAALALKGRRTLLIDLDGQASASLSMGIDRTALKPSIADAILEGRGMAALIRKTDAEGLELVTGSPDLADADVQLAKVTGRERRLKDALTTIRSAYDFIIMDCPPSMGLLVINALVAADAFIVPTPPEFLAMAGLIGLMDAVKRIQEGIGSACQLMGIVLTKVDRRRKVTDQVIQVIRDHYKDQVFRTEVRVDVRLIEAPSFGQTIFQYAGGSAGAEAYRQLADEVIRRKGRAS
jgi:chromosome partitioning protein